MAATRVHSDFEFKDDRTYVHGSTLIEWCWRVARDQAGADRWSQPCVDATFTRWVHANGVFWTAEDAKSLPERQRLSALFRVYDARRAVWLGFEEQPEWVVERRVNTTRRIDDCRLLGSFSGSCLIDARSLPVLLENVLEANKRLHLLSVADRGRPAVINAYMRRFPLAPTGRDTPVRLDVENVSCKELGGTIATMNRLICSEVAPEPFEISYMLKFGVQS
jgi:hypothetical protein